MKFPSLLSKIAVIYAFSPIKRDQSKKKVFHTPILFLKTIDYYNLLEPFYC